MDAPAIEAVEVRPPTRRKRKRWLSGLLKGLVALLLLAIVAVGGIALFLDTAPGHRFLADRIAALAPSTGLRIRVGRIDGSIWGETRLRDVRVYDPQGLFAESPLIALDWQPAAWIANRLSIDALQSDLVVLHRLPKFRPSERPGPILPGFDIRVGKLDIAQLRIEPAVTGERRFARIEGEADIRSGRALVRLAANVRGGDRLSLLLDAEPDRDRFDVDVSLIAPADSVAGAIVGTRRPIALAISGDGTWSSWGGTAALDVAGRRTASLALRAREGRYSLSGETAPSPFLHGKLQRLSAPKILVNGQARLADRRLDGRLSLRSAALRVETGGVVDLAAGGYDDVRIGIDLLRPAALFPNMSGNRIRLTALLDGPFGAARFAYRIAAPRFAFDQTGFEDARAEGRGRLSKAPVSVPLRFTARRVTGVGAVAGGILGNLSVEGVLKVTARRLTGEGLTLRSEKLRGKLSLLVDLVTGRYDVALSGGLTRYLIPGLGIVDVLTELKVVPNPSGRGTLVTGRGRAWVRRLDNKFLLSLAGGLPRIETGLVRDPDGVIRFRGLVLTGPSIRVTGNGLRRRNGTFLFEGTGTQAQYGPFAITLDGQIDRPKLVIRLARPMDALGLSDVLLNLDPTPEGFAYRAAGGSTLGPFASAGVILLPGGAPATIRVDALAVSGIQGRGALRSDPGGFNGRLDLSGSGLAGHLLFAPVGQNQRIEAHIVARNADLAGPPQIRIRSGKLDGVILLDPAGTSIEGSVSARGFSSGGLSIASIDATARMRGGRGQVKLSLAGSRGRQFAFTGTADIAPERIAVAGSGSVEGRPLEIDNATLAHEGRNWRLSGAALRFAGGSANLSGLFGPGLADYNARVEAMPLSLLDIFYPELGLGGSASGTIAYRSAAAGVPPSGSMNLRIRGLTRAGLVLSSRPVDIGIAARLIGNAAAARAVAVSEGKTIGRAQARIAPLAGEGRLPERLLRAPLFAQIRYNGAADTLWRLTGIELIDLSGPVAVGADIGGSLNDPQIRGSLRTETARLESAVTGTVVQNLKSSGRFDGSRLLLDSFSGTTRDSGTIAGRGAFDLAAARGFGIDIAIDADNALLIARDDLRARVTGPIRIRSDGSGGVISGAVTMNSGAFRLGRAAAATQVARLPVRELNRPADEAEPPRPGDPWRLDLKVAARNRLEVTGLGISSEWGADLAVGGTVNAPRITGEAELVRGTYDFAGRRFDLERGNIRFTGESPVNPVLDIVAEGGVQGLNAVIRVTGRGLKPEIAFTSTPALPQDELLSRLLFGTSIANLSAPEALQLAAAVAALSNSGGGLDPINAVRNATGLDRLRILPADITTGQGTSLAAGKYLGRRFYVEVVTDGRGYSATQLEYQITRWLSLLSTISTVGRQSANVRVSKDY